MLSDSDVALARLAQIAYNAEPDGTPAGFYRREPGLRSG